MIDVLAYILLIWGSIVVLISAVGIWRIGDPLAQLHVTSKAGTLGAVMIVLALALQSGDGDVFVRCILIFLFLVLTGPVASHAIAVAYYGQYGKVSADENLDQMAAVEVDEEKPQV